MKFPLTAQKSRALAIASERETRTMTSTTGQILTTNMTSTTDKMELVPRIDTYHSFTTL